jgi:hypothetical protein
MPILESCPNCRGAFGGNMGINCGLGSPRYVCKYCGAEFLSGRQEWRDMGRLRRFWYILATLAYMGFLGFLGGAMWQGAWRFLKEGPRADARIFIGGGTFWIGAGVVAFAVCVLQWLRVHWSLRRSAGLDRVNLYTSSLQTGMQVPWIFLLFGIYIFCYLLSYLIHVRIGRP